MSSCCNYNAAPKSGQVQSVSCPADFLTERACTAASGYSGQMGACTAGSMYYSAAGVPTKCVCAEGINCSARALSAPRPALAAPLGASEDVLWSQWLAANSRPGALRASPQEKATFLKSVKAVQAHESGKQADQFTLGLTNLAAEAPADFKKRLGLKPLSKAQLRLQSQRLRAGAPAQLPPAPVALDWRLRGSVTRSKDQGSCGSCYVFAAVAVMEAFYARTSGQLVNVAEQPLIGTSCIPNCGGCGSGGVPSEVLEIVVKKGSTVFPMDKKPYTGKDTQCQLSGGNLSLPNMRVGQLEFADGVSLDAREVMVMQHLAAYGPMAIAVGVPVDNSWQLYAGGLLTPPSTYAENPMVNHAVTLVGYTETEWIVKNSWSDGQHSWGLAGFVLLPKSSAWTAAVERIGKNKQSAKYGPWGIFSYPMTYVHAA
jgi:hypothetical protein